MIRCFIFISTHVWNLRSKFRKAVCIILTGAARITSGCLRRKVVRVLLITLRCRAVLLSIPSRHHPPRMAHAQELHLPRPIEIIFSCAVCQATIREVYKRPENDKSLRGAASSDQEQSITKLWLTECAHLVCGKHFQGG